MKKSHIALILALLLVPAITNAAWWNPFSWFDGWSFLGFQDSQTEILEERVQELEKKLEEKNSTSTESSTTAQNTDKEDDNQENNSAEPVSGTSNVTQPDPAPTQPASTPAPTQTGFNPSTSNTAEKPEDFRVKCELSRDRIDQGDRVSAEIKIMFENNSDYEIDWQGTDYLLREIDHGEALFEINDWGQIRLSAKVTRKSDEHTQDVTCVIPVDPIEEKGGDVSGKVAVKIQSSESYARHGDIPAYVGFKVENTTEGQISINSLLFSVKGEGGPYVSKTSKYSVSFSPSSKSSPQTFGENGEQGGDVQYHLPQSINIGSKTSRTLYINVWDFTGGVGPGHDQKIIFTLKELKGFDEEIDFNLGEGLTEVVSGYSYR
ncbi:MAG: hypothetical protein WDZ79_02570 [Candidatus Paceibacterota bacterium]